ncbi:RIP metalloprotease RseP [Lentilactobacillus curieae]|uniref:Zinc metalloprotease n=1 Tax=Lentilactobacillus curieae TaxID=1138822 RepID=A0A1S6QKQ6_9LACO|nr:RIP metalloprotease RseP [Lentilactobacillus curieae]AQW22153.1 RIP metalloprotease RseP [Lentilactobacillus curieae]
MITTIIAFIIVFGIIVISHEFGHYYAAKKSGILVREFSVGMGPKLFYYIKNHTTFTLRLLPLGGYVRMAGDADDEEEIKPGTPVSLKVGADNKVTSINTSNKNSLFQGIPVTVVRTDLEQELFIEGYENGDESELKRYSVAHDATIIESDGTEVQIAPVDVQFQSASLPKRMITNVAGVFNNFVLTILVFTILAFVQGGVANNSTKIDVAPQDSVAKDAGIKNGDQILSVDGVKTKNWSDLATQIQGKAGKNVDLKVKRNDQTKIITLTPKTVKSGDKKVGVIGITQHLDNSFKAKILGGFTQTFNLTGRLLSALWSMVSGHFSLNDLGGPVAIFATTSQATKGGVAGVMYFLAFLSLNLAIINLIPIPGLDGGKLLLNIIEAIRHKPVSEKTETVITLIGFAFLMLLMILVTWNDISRYFLH